MKQYEKFCICGFWKHLITSVFILFFFWTSILEVFNMPQISNFLYCMQTSNEEDQFKIIDPLNVIPIESTPGRFTFSIMFSIVGFDPSKDHEGHIVFRDPENNILIETDKFPVSKEDSPNKEDSKPIVTGLSLGVEFVNVLFETEGVYKTQLYLNNEVLGEFVIPAFIQMVEGSEG